MSFDLFFVKRGGFPDPARVDVEVWDAVVAAAGPLLPEPTVTTGEGWRQLADEPTGIQVLLSDHELTISVPYWYEGEDARLVVDILRGVALAVEGATGLVAHDPQVERPFIEEGVEAAPGMFTRARSALDQLLRGGEE